MKTLYFSILTLLSFGLKSQITIDKNDFLESEDSVGISTSADLALDFVTTGPNSTWDFSTLTESGQFFETAKDMASAGIILNIQFGPFAPAEYQSSYFQ